MLRRIHRLLWLLVAAPLAHAQLVPTEFVQQRIFAVARDPGGSTVRLFVDSGGGANAISEPIAGRLRLPHAGTVAMDEGSKATVVDFPAFLREAGIPEPLSDEPWLHGRMMLAPRASPDADGLLGSRWFAGRVWAIDYGARTLQVLPSSAALPLAEALALGFRTDDSGRRDLNFPRIAITVDGRSFDVLLDTGATATLSADAARTMGLAPGTPVGTCFVIRSIFESWKKNHPDWRVVAKADVFGKHAYDMIEIPRLTVGGATVGPVWFAQRPDPNFLQYMSMMTDKPVSGSLGGSALQYLRVVLDYPQGKAWMQPHSR